MTGFARLIISLSLHTKALRANGLTYLSCSTKIQPLHPFFHLNICMIYSNMPHPHHMIYLILLDIFTFIKVILIYIFVVGYKFIYIFIYIFLCPL